MSGLEADTIGGFNSMIERQKKEEGEALVSTVLFSNDSRVIHDRVSLKEIEPMTVLLNTELCRTKSAENTTLVHECCHRFLDLPFSCCSGWRATPAMK